jgi:predicted AlkP superfamily phosphohydrolase/phosphomutase
VVGIDGGEWTVIHRLWEQGRLPHLKALAERGAAASLGTNYTASPVIWTTIATGRKPEDHGIIDFVVPTAQGDVPVASTLRKVPALWNMLSRARRRVAVLGWWASWPAEEVEGVVVSDRALLDLPQRVSPAAFLPTFEQALAAADGAENPFDPAGASGRQDHVLARLATSLAGQDFDLILLYLRGVDIASHYDWKYLEPEHFPTLTSSEAEVRAGADRIFRQYEAVDLSLGQLLEAAGPQANVLVLSDHGFKAAAKETVRVFSNFDLLLEKLGFLHRNEQGGAQGIDLAKTELFTYQSPDFKERKMLRISTEEAAEPGARRFPEAVRTALLERLAAQLSHVTFGNGRPAFHARLPRPREERRGADLIVVVHTEDATQELLYDGDGERLQGVIRQVRRISGTHTTHTDGIFLAAGPDIDPRADLTGLRIHDVAPTILYGLGLPVAENFAGRPWMELFTEEFRRQHPLRTIASWDVEREGTVTPSAADPELVEQLRSLGYL